MFFRRPVQQCKKILPLALAKKQTSSYRFTVSLKYCISFTDRCASDSRAFAAQRKKNWFLQTAILSRRPISQQLKQRWCNRIYLKQREAQVCISCSPNNNICKWNWSKNPAQHSNYLSACYYYCPKKCPKRFVKNIKGSCLSIDRRNWAYSGFVWKKTFVSAPLLLLPGQQQITTWRSCFCVRLL